MNIDQELEAWREQWTAQPTGSRDLTARVRRQSRFMRLMLLTEALVTVVMGGGTIWRAAASRQLADEFDSERREYAAALELFRAETA